MKQIYYTKYEEYINNELVYETRGSLHYGIPTEEKYKKVATNNFNTVYDGDFTFCHKELTLLGKKYLRPRSFLENEFFEKEFRYYELIVQDVVASKDTTMKDLFEQLPHEEFVEYFKDHFN